MFLLIGAVNTSVAADYQVYKVKKGDTLRSISVKYLKSPKLWKHFLAYNKLKNGNQIKPGMKLKIPYSISKMRVAKVKFAVGNVKVIKNGKAYKARRGMYLLQNHTILTGSKGKAELILDEGSVIRVGAKTKFALKNYAYRGKSRKTNLGLNKGSLAMKVTKLSKKSNFQVSTVTAVAGVRGTFFYVNYDENSEDVGIAVYTGAVDVSVEEDADKDGVRVEKGYATTIHGAKDIEEPFPIPAKIKWVGEE